MSRIAHIFKKASRALTAPLAENGFTPTPVYLFLELTRKCTHRCNMCNIWKEGLDGMPLPEMQRIFTHPFFDQIERVILTGGEPTLRRDIGDIGRMFVDRLPRLNLIAILTTGFGSKRILTVAEQMLEQLDRHPRKPRLLVQVSFDAVGDTYNKIRNIGKAWAETQETVMRLLELRKVHPRLDVMLHCVIQPLNVRELDAIEEFSRQHNVSALYSLAVISNTYFGNADLAEGLALSTEESAMARAFLSREREYATPETPLYYEDLANMLGGATRSRKCMMGYYMIYVQMSGKVYPCVNSGDLLIGDLTKQSPEEIWFAPTSNDARKKVRRDYCPTCASACYSDVTGFKEVVFAALQKLKRKDTAR